MDSKLAIAARNETLTLLKRLTAEQRLNAFLAHCQLMVALYRNARSLRSGRPAAAP